MKKSELTVTYNPEKLAALRQYAAKKEVDLEAELAVTLDRLYEKLVPAAVREYLAAKGEN